jgi:deoxyribodipyrimidine photo-lyase
VLAAVDTDVVLPLFVFDPGFYGERGLACDSRLRFLHESLSDLADGYHTASGGEGGLTYAHGDPVGVLREFVRAGWEVVAARAPTGRHGRRRDERAREAGVRFVSGDGLVRDAERPREGWKAYVESWFAGEQYRWSPREVRVVGIGTGVDVARVERHYRTQPTKTEVPPGGTGAGRERLESFTERIGAYPESISSPVDARKGTSGLSPYLKFGCLSVREVYQHVTEHAPDCRGRELFVSRLFWNKHYEQKLEDWPGWLDGAVNPALRGFNRDRYDPERVAAWKRGRTGYPMVDASMRCLSATGWLNFRMRAMCASFFFHVLSQPWRIGADWFHHHLVDSTASINYTQWQYQCGLVGKPTLRVYNPRKQVRDQDPEGVFVRRWVPELEGLPAEHLDRPERTPLHVQAECGVEVGTDYPRPIVEYEAAKASFRDRYGPASKRAAARLGEESIARRASLSGGLPGARRIAAEHGHGAEEKEQTDLSAFD